MHNRKPKRGMTLIEIFVGAMLFSLLLFALYSLFRVGRSFSHSASFSHMVSREFEAGVRQLRRDLRQTSLITMRSYPNPDTDDAPGLTLLSAYDENGPFPGEPSRHAAMEPPRSLHPGGQRKRTHRIGGALGRAAPGRGLRAVALGSAPL